MTKLTSVLSDTWRGLLARRLWPVAILLLAAMVAVPVFLAAEPEPVLPAPDSAAAKDELAAQPLVTVASAAERESVRRVLGARKDPFKPSGRPVREPRDERARTSGDAGSGAGGARIAINGGSGSAAAPAGRVFPSPGGGSTYVPPAAAAPDTTIKRPPPPPAGSLAVRWGVAGDEELERRLVERLDPLPDPDEPLLVYLGLTRDGRSAVFMLDAGVTVDGDGRCRPDPAHCQTVELAPGETQFFEVVDEAGSTTQFQLDLVKIHGRRAAATRTLRASAAVNERATRRALRSLGDWAPTYDFDAETGTLEPTDAGE